MFVLQEGLLNGMFGIIIAIMLIAGFVYFAALPSFILWKATKTLKTRSRIIIGITYIVLVSAFGAIFLMLPGYFMSYNIDILSASSSLWSILHKTSMYIFLLLPMVFMIAIGVCGNLFGYRRARQQIAD